MNIVITISMHFEVLQCLNRNKNCEALWTKNVACHISKQMMLRTSRLQPMQQTLTVYPEEI